MLKRILQSRGMDLCVLGILLFLVVYRQPFYPGIWFDEGMVIQGSINLVKYGQYAMYSAEGFRVLDQPLIANGPGVILPISLAFSIWGIGFLQARLVIAVYFVCSVILFNAVSRSLYGKPAAWISLFLLMALPEEGFIFYGRQVLGNMPGFAYFLAGCYFFMKFVGRKRTSDAFLTGLLWGICMITKGQYLILLPVFAVVAIADYLYYKNLGIKGVLTIVFTAVVCVIVWQYVQYVLVGAENFQRHVEAVASSAKVTILAFEPQRIPGSAWYLIRSGFLIIVVPCLLVTLKDSSRKNSLGIFSFFISIFVLSWLSWYLFASVGWKRYAFEMFSTATLASGAFIQRMFISLQDKTHRNTAVNHWLTFPKVSTALFLIVVFIWGMVGLVNQVKPVLGYRDTTVFQFADYLGEHVPAGSVVESWEWELDALAPELRFHHPDNSWVDRKTAEIQFDEPVNAIYQLPAALPDYLIDGPFSKRTDLYAHLIRDHCCRLLVSIGNYDLYKIK